jgi:hypothetical protein
MRMGVTVPTGSPILVWVNSVLFCDFRLHWRSADEFHTVQTKYVVNWPKVRTKVSVDSLGVRIFTPIFRG